LDRQNNYVERFSVDDNVVKNFNILVHNYFDGANKIIFTSVFS